MSAGTQEAVRPGVFGARVERLEDQRLLRGLGRYVDDLEHDAAEIAFVRSEHAHARIRDVDVSGALGVDGVYGVFTYEDLDGRFADPLPLLIPNKGLIDVRTQHALAREEVCFAGETIAMVVARDRYVAEDAAARIHVDYEVLEPVVDLEAAAAAGAPVAHSDMADNVAAFVTDEVGDVEAGFAASTHVFSWRFDIERSASMPMEGRALVARFDDDEGHLLVFDSTQAPTGIRAGLAYLFEMDVEEVHVVAPDVGGGFGAKVMQFYPEEVLVPWAARRLRRTVKWTEDRREHFIGTNHERRQIHDVRVGCDAEGRIVAMETTFVHDTGAYCPYGLIVPIVAGSHAPGPYRLPNFRYAFRAIYTNTVVTSPYRGAGRPHGVFVMERTMERLARELGIDSAELRRRNLIQPEDMPYEVGIAYQDGGPTVYDSGDYPAGLELLLEAVGYDGFEEERRAAAAEGRRIGIGIGCYVEGSGNGPYEGAAINVQPDGTVTVATGLSTQGQAHETVFAQIAADVLGVPLERVKVTTGDTRRIPYGTGTFASRAAVISGNAVELAAREVRRQAVELAARTLDVEPEELELADGEVRVADAPEQRVPLGVLASIANPLRYAYGGEEALVAARLSQKAYGTQDRPLREGTSPGLNTTGWYSPTGPVFGYGMHAAVVEVDAETCDVRVLRYVVVHDCGRMINPLVVDGQVQGGVAQGVGGALYERIAYDDRGQIQNASFMDFLIPYATEVPRPELHHIETPSPNNPLGVKGVGEAGLIPTSAAIANALQDALAVPVDRMPISPREVFRLVHGAEAGAEG
ncbi:MAG TPA: aerobic carbon-monoxide dehydrogenase large subunit [Conexibacter sp.]|nr:aerobic carbon-monoxide dehydrogenase large subunit [Conexibacter sp.]